MIGKINIGDIIGSNDSGFSARGIFVSFKIISNPQPNMYGLLKLSDKTTHAPCFIGEMWENWVLVKRFKGHTFCEICNNNLVFSK